MAQTKNDSHKDGHTVNKNDIQKDIQKDSGGFSLPAPDAAASADQAASATVVQLPADRFDAPHVVSDTASRDLLIGGGIWLVLVVGLFFIKNAWANNLVAQRVPPTRANMSGWWLYICLFSIATAAVVATVNASQFMLPQVVVPVAVLTLLAVLALVLTLLSSRK